MTSLRGMVLLALVSTCVGNPETAQKAETTAKRGQRSSSSPLCRKSQVEPSPPESGHEPWTHAPFCVKTGTDGNELCVFTDANFHGGQGLSIVSRPEVASKIIESGLLQTPYPATGEANVKYEAVQRRPEVGIGLFVKASERYRAGEIIMVDYPTMIIPSGVVDSISLNTLNDLRWKALLQVPDQARFRTRDLAQSKGRFMDEIVNIFETNAFTHSKGGALHDIIFPEASRINHHCLPNAFTRTNQSTLAMEVAALRDLLPGEEIFISYLDPNTEMSSAKRQAALSSGWGFSCQCSICRVSKENNKSVVKSDERREKIGKTKKLIKASTGQALAILKHVKTLISLYDEEGMIMPKADNYELAAYAAKYGGRPKEAEKYANLAKHYWEIMFGEGSKEAKGLDKFMKTEL